MERTLKDDSLPTQIEYILHQSTLGIHFIFDNAEIARVLSEPKNEKDVFTQDKMVQVQDMLSKFLDRPTIVEKRSYLEKLKKEDFNLLVRAYFQLVENTILSNSKIRH